MKNTIRRDKATGPAIAKILALSEWEFKIIMINILRLQWTTYEEMDKRKQRYKP